MTYQEFRKAIFEPGCFNINQVNVWHPGFDKNNLGRWVKKGLIIKLKNGLYSFPDYLQQPDFSFYLANQIYKPSYISLHSALAFYGMIPEAIVQVTSVTSLKTNLFTNKFGSFSYKSVQEKLMFGYDIKSMSGSRTFHLAKPEKALLDLLYLYPFYDTEDEMVNLRLDEDFIHNDFDHGIFETFLAQFNSKALEYRVKKLVKAYRL